MRKIRALIFIVIVTASFALQAQPSLTFSSALKTGDSFTTGIVSASGLLPGSAGANQVWDFSHVSASGFDTIAFVSAASTPYSSNYPSATLASLDRNGNYIYFGVNSSEEDSLGEEDSTNYLIYSSGQKTLGYPFIYNDSFTGNFTGTGSRGYKFVRRGNLTVKADGYGTLKTPAGTFYNVLRISRKENMIDTFFNLEAKYTYAIQSYSWYMDGFSNSLFTLVFDTTSFSGNQIITPSAFYAVNTPTAVNNIAPAIFFNIFPNPAVNKIFIITNGPVNRVVISNVLGQHVIDQREDNAPGKSLEISVADLPTGIYLCDVIMPIGNVTRRLVKQ